MTKKIAFGTTLLDKGLLGLGIDGIGQYCQELLSQFSRQAQDINISPYSFGIDSSPSNARLLPAYPTYLAKSLLRINSQSAANQYFDSVDLIHSTDQLIPIVSNKPLVATVMDTIPLSHPQFIKARSRIIKPFVWKKLAQRADHIITISEFSKEQIIQFMGYSPEKITSIPLGVDERYFEKILAEDIKAVLTKLKISQPFFLFIGSIQPRKNLQRLIEAHSLLPRNLAKEFPLVIAGKFAWDDGDILNSIQKGIEENRCIWLNYVDDLEKRCLLQSTIGMTFTSLYEGFGLPILEGFASGAPVVTSNCSSMPEVAKNAALFADPKNVDSIRNALISLIDDHALVEQLKLSGFTQAKKFSWEKTARETEKVYQALK
ncbi:MAG: glycosyltransferase family 4 protein [Polynucleobacter sp.]|nr:glycosyltransferase family 4 protein [Polynucleobacter sp.]